MEALLNVQNQYTKKKEGKDFGEDFLPAHQEQFWLIHLCLCLMNLRRENILSLTNELIKYNIMTNIL